MSRRKFLLIAAAALSAPGAPWAQQPGRIYRIGSAYVARPAIVRPYEEAFLQALRELGFQVGRNVVYDVRYCDGEASCLPAMVDELIALKPDLLVGIEQVAGVMRAKTATIPILLTNSTDPVGAGLAQSLARPGGNVTGISNFNEVLSAKQVELLKEILPGLATVALLLDPTGPSMRNIERQVRQMADGVRVKVSSHVVDSKAALDRSFAALEQARPGALVVGAGSGFFFGHRRFMIDSALRMRVPYAGGSSEGTAEGGFLSYGSSLGATFRSAAPLAARILRGSHPSEMPIEQPTTFELAINLKTARTLGIRVPQSVLLRADRLFD